MGSHSLDILFYAFFEAPSWTEELEGKQDILLSILRLGETLGVRFAFPTTTMHIEEFPGNGSTTPKYDTNPDSIDQKLEEFIKTLNEKIACAAGYFYMFPVWLRPTPQLNTVFSHSYWSKILHCWTYAGGACAGIPSLRLASYRPGGCEG
jgi:hypothetical protein